MEERLQVYINDLEEILQSSPEEQAVLQDHIKYLREQISLMQQMIENGIS